MHISEKKKRSGKKTVLKVFLALLLLVFAGGAGAAYWQRENIKAFLDSKKYSQEELSEQMTKSKEKVQQSIEQYDIPVMRDFTVEEEEKIRKGELSAEEAMQLILAPSADDQTEEVQNGNTAESASTETASETQGTAEQAGTAEKSAKKAASASSASPVDNIVANYVTRVYSLKAYYIGQLGAVESEMRSVYVNGGRDKTQIPAIVKSYLPQVASLESECDSQISGLVSGLRSELSAIGADTSIADQIYDAYINEKALRKAYYLGQY